MRKKLTVFILLALAALALAACGGSGGAAPAACPDCPECPQIDCAAPLGGEVPYETDWAGSGHADSTAEAFRHWDGEESGLVAADCVKCHSTAGYIDFAGGDGSAAGSIENEVVAADVVGIQCVACHNTAVAAKDSVVMPSGLELTGLGAEARCIECHQGRESMVSVNDSILAAAGVEDLAAVDPDAVLEGLGFRNIHYFAAAVSKFGTMAKGGYQYAGKSYDAEFAHVDEYSTCVDCHDSHSLEVKAVECVACHGEGDPTTFRMEGSLVDYDGDGNMEEGIASEIEGLQAVLAQALSSYSADVLGAPIVYNGDAYPYFFVDTNGDGVADEAESVRDNGYASWSPRLLQAAYNYQVSVKDPGGFAHGGKYIIQLLYDSIADLAPALAEGLHRDDAGHFMGSSEAFRHWDEEGEVPGSCARCHSADGLPLYVTQGAEIAQELSNGFKCTTCHGGGDFPARYLVDSVTFPSGKSVTYGEGNESGLCSTCHQGRESGSSIASAVAGLEPNQVSDSLRFRNVHYFPAGATRFGTESGIGYEFPDKVYAGYFEHVAGFQTCTSCHDAHELKVNTEACFACHSGVESVDEIRMSDVDYDGDGDAAEGMAGEVQTLLDALYAAMQDYSASTEGVDGIVYDTNAYPYFFNDAGESYSTWTPGLLEAAYNLQYVTKDPGAFAHNGPYVVQLLIDSIEAVGGNTSAYTRP